MEIVIYFKMQCIHHIFFLKIQIKPWWNVKYITCDFYLQSLDSVCNPIINKPKPKVEPPKEEKKENKEGNKDGQKDSAAGEKSANNSAESEAKPESKQEMEVDWWCRIYNLYFLYTICFQLKSCVYWHHTFLWINRPILDYHKHKKKNFYIFRWQWFLFYSSNVLMVSFHLLLFF